MNPSIIRISLDLTRRDVQCTTAVGQGETGRRIEIRLLENGKPYEITGDCFAVLAGTKPDGNTIYNGCVIRDNTVIYDMTKQMAAVCGAVKCQVKLASVDGGEIASPKFLIAVHEKAYDQTVVESASELGALAELCGLADKAREGAVTAKEGAEEAARRAEAAEERTKEVIQTEVYDKHNNAEGPAVHKYIQDRIDTNAMRIVNLNAQLKGIARSFTVDTFQALMSFLNREFAIQVFEDRDGNGEDEVYEIYPEDLRTGDNIFIIEESVPDFWFSQDIGHENTYDYNGEKCNLAARGTNGEIVGYMHKLEVDYNVIYGSVVSAGLSAERAEQAAQSAQADAQVASDAALNAGAAAMEVKNAKETMLQEIELAASIVQTTGGSETSVMSQKATTDRFNILTDKKFVWKLGYNIYDDGKIDNSSKFAALSDFSPCNEGDLLTYDGEDQDASGFKFNVYIHLFDKDQIWLKRVNRKTVVDGAAKYYRVSFARGSDTGVNMGENSIAAYFSFKHYTRVAADFEKLDVMYNETQAIPDDTDFDDIVQPGKHITTDANSLGTMHNAPNTPSPGTLFVFESYKRTRLIQLFVDNEAHVFIRTRKSNAEFTEWKQLKDDSTTHGFANHTADGLKAVASINKCLTRYTCLQNVTQNIDGKETVRYAKGATYEGVPYTPAHYYSADCLYNFNLETQFSLFNNPNSLMYTRRNPDGRAYTGCVCSSFVGWLLGLPIYYTTYDMLKMLNYKDITDLSEIEIGDVLITHTLTGSVEDHVMVVSNIFTDDTGVKSIEISEAWSPNFRKVNYSASRFWGLLAGTTRPGAPYRVGRFDNTRMKVIPPLTVNTDIITERGDNTYFELGEDIFIQSTNTSITVEDMNGKKITVDLTALPVKDGTTMRNVAGVLDSIGKWKLYGAVGEVSRVTIIKKGEAVVEDDVLKVSGYKGCKPCGYAVVAIYNGNIGHYETHLDNPDYTASRLTIYSKDDPRYAGTLDGDTMALDMSEIDGKKNYIGYYVRVFYETGCGQAYRDTNIVYFNT